MRILFNKDLDIFYLVTGKISLTPVGEKPGFTLFPFKKGEWSIFKQILKLTHYHLNSSFNVQLSNLIVIQILCINIDSGIFSLLTLKLRMGEDIGSH